jgi:hypothetical protein
MLIALALNHGSASWLEVRFRFLGVESVPFLEVQCSGDGGSCYVSNDERSHRCDHMRVRVGFMSISCISNYYSHELCDAMIAFEGD